MQLAKDLITMYMLLLILANYDTQILERSQIQFCFCA